MWTYTLLGTFLKLILPTTKFLRSTLTFIISLDTSKIACSPFYPILKYSSCDYGILLLVSRREEILSACIMKNKLKHKYHRLNHRLPMLWRFGYLLLSRHWQILVKLNPMWYPLVFRTKYHSKAAQMSWYWSNWNYLMANYFTWSNRQTCSVTPVSVQEAQSFLYIKSGLLQI